MVRTPSRTSDLSRETRLSFPKDTMLARRALAVSALFVVFPLWAQMNPSSADGAATGIVASDDHMLIPTPVGIEGYGTAFAAETPRSNYMRGELRFGGAYDDNILHSSSRGVSDLSYSIWPSFSLIQSRSTVRWNMMYSSGLTFYQKNTSYNETDHTLDLSLEYRLSPYVTLTLADRAQKTSNPLYLSLHNSDDLSSGVIQRPHLSIVPITDIVNNVGNAEIAYQFGKDSMVGAKGELLGLWYPDREQVAGLFDSRTEAGEAFYAHRFSRAHYLGVTYQFQALMSRPSPVDTHTNSVLVFYTFTPGPRLSVSLFIGPEYSRTQGGNLDINRWSPAAGASLGWQGNHTSASLSYSRRISEGGGLRVAVLSSSLDGSARWQLSRTLTAGLRGSYSLNTVIDEPLGQTGGHTASGAASLERSLGEHLGMQIGYTRLRQRYTNFFIATDIPDRNYIWLSLSYHFQRPLGR